MGERQRSGVPRHKFMDGPDQIVPAYDYTTWIPENAVKLRMTLVGMSAEKPVSVPGLLTRIAEKYPDSIAMASKKSDGIWHTINYKQYRYLTRTAAKGFLKLGLERYHSVAILGFNSQEWFLADLAAIHAGGIAAGIYKNYSTEACLHSLSSSRANICVVQDKSQLDKVLKVRSRLPHLKAIVQWEEPVDTSIQGVYSWDQLIEMGEKESDMQLENILKSIAVNECCTLAYTSTSVSPPNVVMLSHDNLTWDAFSVSQSMRDMRPDGARLVSFLPLSHPVVQVINIYTTMAKRMSVYFPKENMSSLGDTFKEVQPTRMKIESIEELYDDTIIKSEGFEKPQDTCTRGRHIIMGFLNDQEATIATLRNEGWNHIEVFGRVPYHNLDYFCCNDLSFYKIINNIMILNDETYDENVNIFQKCIASIKYGHTLSLRHLQYIVNAYIKPAQIRDKVMDNRVTIEVKAKNIVVSHILKHLNTRLSENSEIEEVHFVGGNIIHVDTNLECEVWHGKNIVIFTKAIKVHGEVTWNISGKDSDNVYSENAGTDGNGHGKKGADGFAGESGGNILIVAEQIEGQEKFNIISNGGKGGNGQNGGNGKDGKDGTGITCAEFDEKFPSVVLFTSTPSTREELVAKTIRNIESSMQIDKRWYKNKNDHLNDDIFIETKLKEGSCITFSYRRAKLRTEAFLLYKGSEGKPGGQGGEHGLSGQGGSPGNIEIIIKDPKNKRQGFQTVKNTKGGIDGNDGENGQGGLFGNYGKTGCDMGYLDHQMWGAAKFRGRNQQSKCTIETYSKDNNPSDRIWCPYKDCYVGIKASNIEHKKQRKYEERNRSRQNNDRKHHALAVNKKNIIKTNIFSQYSIYLSSMENSASLQILQSNLECNQQVLHTLNENQKHQEKQSISLGVKRNLNFFFKRKNKQCYNSILKTTSEQSERQNVENILKKLKPDPKVLNDWFQLKNIELNQHELNKLYSEFEILKRKCFDKQDNQTTSNSTLAAELKYIEQLLLDKYRFTTLQEISKLLPNNQINEYNMKWESETTPRYLIETKINDNNISHAILGTLNQYFFNNGEKQRKNILQFCKDEFQNTEHKALKCSIEVFVTEVGSLQDKYESVKKYYDEYQEFLEKHERSLHIFFEPFKCELTRSCLNRDGTLFDLWLNSLKDISLKGELENKIKGDNFLKGLYERFNNEFRKEYDWERCYQVIKEEHNIYMQEQGPLSGSYRELLAHVFDVNIRLYVEDEDSQLCLRGNHNPSSTQMIHMLCRDSQFVQLNLNKAYWKLGEERKLRNKLYARVLAEIEPFVGKHSFDEYYQKKTFLSYSNLPEEEEEVDDEFNTSHIVLRLHCVSEIIAINNIVQYFPEEERQQLKDRLDKITSQYIGQQDILHNLLKRLSGEGRYVTTQQLYCLINSIISSVNADAKDLNIWCWIIAAYPQINWIDELILLDLENYFKRILTEKTSWRNYMSKIQNKQILFLFKMKLDQHQTNDSISSECIEDTLRLLNYISDDVVILEGLELSEWRYALKEKYWTWKLSQIVNWLGGDLATASYYILSIENIYGAALAEKFIEALEKKKHELSAEMLIKILSHFYNEKGNLSDNELNTLNNNTIAQWNEKVLNNFTANNKERKIAELIELIKGNSNTSKDISNKLSEIKNCVESIENYFISTKPINTFTDKDIKHWVSKFQTKQNVKEMYKEILSVIDRGIQLKKGFKLRDTQRLTIMALVTNNQSTLAQVSTGEGKTLIVVAATIMKALCKEMVDIITSSSVLAKRDSEINKDLYNLFGINVSHNCSEDIEKRKEAYSGNQVVYGDLSNWQRDYLLDRFYGKNILGDRNFENVIVDEVDSMLLDKGNNMLYLSHDIAGLDKLESVYLYIWQWVNRPAKDSKELSHAFNKKVIKEAVLYDVFGILKREDVRKNFPNLDEEKINKLWVSLIKAKVFDDQGKLLRKDFNDIKLDDVFELEFNCYKDRLLFLIKECIEREKFIHVPNNLQSFTEQHIESWINSAITAYCMKAGEDYVVDVDKTGTVQDRHPNVTILDRDTGTDQANSQWDEALHQFLQLKHGCKLSLQSLKAVFISNVSYFKLYRNLYGLTGTLGSKRERDLLQEIYKVEFIIVPQAKPKQFHENKPILCSKKEEWIITIRNVAKKLTDEKNRSVLIICETVNDVNILYKAIAENNANNVYTYTRDYEEFQNDKDLGPGQIIIATNLAGRGTDIKITKQLQNKGGLHVCLTYLPNNIRVEQQAFGRAARSGDEGSGQLIILGSKGERYSNLKVLDLKKERDSEELRRISEIKAYYETQITTEEECFKSFKEQYEQLKKELNDKKVPTEVKELLLQSCLDKWAFWLDQQNKYFSNLTDERDKRNLHKLLDKFIAKLKQLDTGYSEKRTSGNAYVASEVIIEYDSTSWLAWVEGNPIQMVKLGKYLSQNTKHKNAHKNSLTLFNQVIDQEVFFSEAAHYYKAFALIKSIDWEQRPFKDEDVVAFAEFQRHLKETTRLLDEHSKFAINSASIINKIKKNSNESIIQIDGYEEQQKSLANLYYIFSRSIEDIFGHAITPHTFVNYDINQDLAYSLYQSLLKNGILQKSEIEYNVNEADSKLKVISSSYGVTQKKLKDFLLRSRNEEFDENKFQKSLKEVIELPERKDFWKSLIQGKVLTEEIKFVEINSEKLKEIDPSFLKQLTEKINKNELQKQSLKNEQIILNVDRVTQEEENYNIFTKKDFIQIAGKNKYKVLKERGALSLNRKARIDSSKIKSMTFRNYDCITPDDFTKVNIDKDDAEKILTNLVDQKVIEKKDNLDNSKYGLKIEYDDINKIELSFCPAYENVVKGLLFVCFTYRIALQKVTKRLNQKNFPIDLQLITKPHLNLTLELLEQRVIKPVTVSNKYEDLEVKLKDMYAHTTTADKFQRLLSESKLIPEDSIGDLFSILVEKKWIIEYDATLFAMEKGFSAIEKDNIKIAANSLVKDLYYVNDSEKRRKPLNYFTKSSDKTKQKESLCIDETLEIILDNYLQLSKIDTIQNIASILNRSKSSLSTLNTPDGNLKPLIEVCDFSNIDEVRIFSLNGLDHLLQLQEMKWTNEMLINTAMVTAMGVIQIAIGTAIELFSVGVMTHVGAAFVNEGVNDLFFAAGALKSGYFTWEDYGQHKLQSLMITAATCGIGAYLSRGAKVSHFGHKLAGPTFEYGGKKIAETSGTELIKYAGGKVIAKEVAKRIMLKSLEGITLGFASIGVDSLVENNLRSLCEGVASEILTDIERNVEKHSISGNIEKIFKLLGREKANEIVNDLTKTAFAKKNYVDRLVPIASKIASSVTQGIGEAVKKRNNTSNKLTLPFSAISKTVVWVERLVHLSNIRWITDHFLNNLNKEIENRLSILDKNEKEKEQKQKDYEDFRKQVIDQWKSMMRERAGQIITQYIVSPVLKDGANHMVRYLGRKLQEEYQAFKDDCCSEYLEELKQSYKENLEIEQLFGSEETKDLITVKFHKGLVKLYMKSNNPDLLASIIRENIPMDMVCANACTKVLHKILKEQKVAFSGLTIVVEGENGMKQEFSTPCDGKKGNRIRIPLKLKDNHFTFSENSTSENNTSNDTNNNCLYNSLTEAFPGLQNILSAEDFRSKIADCIQHDEEIRYHIKQNRHRLPITLGAYGGKSSRITTEIIHDDDSSSCNEPYDEYKTRVRATSKHLLHRFERFLRFGGVLQRCSEQSGILKTKIVEVGASQYQDQSSKKGNMKIEAAHVIRLGKINPELTKRCKIMYTEISNFLGHTQNVHKYANDWHGIGGAIDDFHSRSLKELCKIDFNCSLTAEVAETLNKLKTEYISIIDDRINKGKLSIAQKSELIKVKDAITYNTIDRLFEKGRQGYLGDIMHPYQKERKKTVRRSKSKAKNLN